MSEPNSTLVEIKSDSNYSNSTGVNDVKSQIQQYMTLDTMISFVFFIMTCVYFPKAPPTPPSASASVGKTKIAKGLCDLFKNTDAWFCAFAYAITGGTLLAWQVILLE